MAEGEEHECIAALHVNSTGWRTVYDNIKESNYTVENYDTLVNENSTGEVYRFVNILLDASDARSENVHTRDSGTLLLVMFLLFLTVITIWVFKVKRFRVMHETGLAMLYGVIIGVVFHFAFPPEPLKEYYPVSNIPNTSCNLNGTTNNTVFKVGDQIILGNVYQDGDAIRCSVSGRVFQDKGGEDIAQYLLFDPEIFFFALLPPIIFYAGYSLQKRHFFRNLGSLMLYAFAGTTMSCFVVGALMYGYVLTGLDKIISNATNGFLPYPDPNFEESIVPSLLFGSLISATDPVTVLAIFHDLHVDFDLYSLVFGESVMNDAVAIVLYRSVDQYSEVGATFDALKLLESVGVFIGVFVGSFLLGCFMGLVTALLMKFSKLREFPLLESTMFLIMSYSTFLIAELAQLTGIVAVLFCGIMQSYYTYINLSEESRRRTKEIFELINFLAENFVFSYMGLSLFTYRNHQWVPGFISFSFIAILAGRIINIYVLSFLLNLGRRKKISFRFQHMLVFAGLRGAIAFALAIRNTQAEDRQLIFTTTLVIVMVTVLVCGGFTTLALQFLKISVGVEDDSGGLIEDGQEIPYEREKGNWFISKFSKLDKNYLIPLFTHKGRHLSEMCPDCCDPLVICCYKCKPHHDKLEETSDIESDLESEGQDEEEDDVISFRHSNFTHSHHEDEHEDGDLGLGTDRVPEITEESQF